MANEILDQDFSGIIEEDKKRLKEEKKKLKEEQKRQRKEAKEKAKEIAMQEAALEDDSEGSTISVVLVTAVIIIVWLGILCLLVKLDVGGFGSNVLTPILKDVPVINKILPVSGETETEDEGEYDGYTSLKEAVERIRVLEMELTKAQEGTSADAEEVAALRAEIERLKTFESSQVEFQRIKTEFYEEVVYSEKGPGADEYRKFYEEMDPTTAEYLYKEVVKQQEVDSQVQDYARAYSEMKPKEAAAIFEEMTDNLELAAKILATMDAESRGKILGVMDEKIAAKLTKIMDPES
ncbi:MAG: hypothetical protein IJN92_02395 [Lachnospiraceae bacterium]|nr:hypothetical protein [Lachnospiraceae bacterium]